MATNLIIIARKIYKHIARYGAFVLVVCGILWSVKMLPAQSIRDRRDIDSLRAVLAKQIPDTIRVKVLADLSRLLSWNAIEQSESYARTALALAIQVGDKRGSVLAYMRLAHILRIEGKMNEALEQGFRALATAEQLGDESFIAQACGVLGVVYQYAPNYVESMNYTVKALRLYEKLNDREGLTSAYKNIAGLYMLLGNYQRALEFAHKALAMQSRGDMYISILVTLGNAHQALLQADSMTYYFHRAEELYTLNDDQQGLSIIYNNTAEYYRLTKQFAQARVYLDKAMKACVAGNDQVGIAEEMVTFAEVEADMGNYHEAIRIAEQGIQQAKKFNMKELLILLSHVMSQSYERVGDYAKALKYARMAKQYEDSLKLISRDSDERLQGMLEFKQQIEENKLLREQASAQQLKSDRQQFLTTIVAVGLIVSIVSIFVMYRIILERKRIAQVLQDQNNEIQRQKQELETINKDLQAANTFKTDMLKMASHDLKNPLTSILGFSKMIGAGICDPEEMIDMGKDIYQSGSYMYKLILDLLDQAAAELGKMEIHLQPMYVNGLVTMVVNMARTKAELKDQQIILDLQGDPMIHGDATRLQQVMDNLVSNAIKYSPFGKRIWISTAVVRTTTLENDTAKEQDMVRFEIRDEGPGLTDDDKQKLFGHFQRLSAQPTGGESSTGMGLSITKTIIELHQGHIRAESEGEGKGTSFIVEIPVYEMQEEYEQAS